MRDLAGFLLTATILCLAFCTLLGVGSGIANLLYESITGKDPASIIEECVSGGQK